MQSEPLFLEPLLPTVDIDKCFLPTSWDRHCKETDKVEAGASVEISSLRDRPEVRTEVFINSMTLGR